MTNTANQKQPLSRLGMVRKLLARILLHNFWTKVLALFLAVILWTCVITQDKDLTRERVFEDVTIAANGTDTLKRNGYIIISDLDSKLHGATVKANVPQGVYYDAKTSNYNIRVDLTKINSAGTHELPVLDTPNATYGSVKSISPSAITVIVDKYDTRNFIPVSRVMVGMDEIDYEIITTDLTPSVVTISGPKTIVETVECAEVTVNASELALVEGEGTKNLSFRLIDKDGSTVSSDLVEVTSDGSVIDGVIYSYLLGSRRDLEVPSTGRYSGQVADGYQIMEVIVKPNVVTAVGYADDLALLEALSLNQQVNVDGRSESVTQVIEVTKPSEVFKLKPETVSVQVVIGPVIESRTFTDLPVNLVGVDLDLDAVWDADARFSVTVTGPKNFLDQLDRERIRLICDATDLPAGPLYRMPIMVQVEQGGGVAFDTTVYPEILPLELREKSKE